MKIFVTGATGFIGSNFINAALAAGHSIHAVRHSPVSKSRVPIYSEKLSTFQLVWIEKSMLDLTEEDFKGCDVLVHLAAHSANFPYDTIENCLNWNLLAPLKIFRKAFFYGINRYVVAGSCFEYGRSGERYDFIPPDAPLEPTNSYAVSKAASSIAFTQLAVEFGMQLSIHRIFHVYGEGESETRFWPTLRRCALRGEDMEMTLGDQLRDFIHVKDVASQILKQCAVSVKYGEPQIDNLGSGKPQTLRSFAEHWWRKWEAKGELKFGALPYRNNEVMRYLPKLSN